MRKVSVLIGICTLVALALTLVAQAPQDQSPAQPRMQGQPWQPAPGQQQWPQGAQPQGQGAQPQGQQLWQPEQHWVVQ